MIIVEAIIIIGLIYGATKITLKLLEDRRELRQLREDRTARLEAARTAEQLAQEIMLDKEMAREVRDHLDKNLEQPDRSDRD